MPIRSAVDLSTATLSVVPFGLRGLDEFTHESLLTIEHLRQADNVRRSRLALERRSGAKKLWKFADIGASKTFGADTKYGTIPAGSHLETLDAGFALLLPITAVRAGAGNTAYILSSRVNAQSYHVLRATIDENGAVTIGFEKRSGGDCAVTTSAITSGATARLLALFDPIGGTFTVYVDGVASGTPVTGLDVDDGPIAGSGTAWHIGAHYNPATTAIVADTHFDGKCQGGTLLSLRGTRPASGDTTLVDTLIRHSARLWPTPQARNCLFHYDFHNTSTTTAYDYSLHGNNATLTGTPSNTAAILSARNPTNFVGYVDGASGRGDNLVGSAGRLFYETIHAATA